MKEKNNFKISGNIVDPISKRIFSGTLEIKNGIISGITKSEDAEENPGIYILPGLIDSHIHIESSMLMPSEFARIASVHGTVATVSDPHEIANVLGLQGIRFMITNGRKVPFKFYFGASSCVPATVFETAGAEITADDIRTLFEVDGLKYLSEMMNFPGVLFRDPEVMKKIEIAKEFGRPIDGHAPGLTGEDAKKYIGAGISTDHECYLLEEALSKLSYGMKILIREGSAAKNFETLKQLIKSHTDMVMLCSDDKHPNDLVISHINEQVKRALKDGFDLFDVLQAACVNPVKHYKLDVGLLQMNDPADFIVIDNLTDLNILKTFINGILVAENGSPLIESIKEIPVNNFNTTYKNEKDFLLYSDKYEFPVIEALNGQLITNEIFVTPKYKNGAGKNKGREIISDIENDILKIAVINRYRNSTPALGLIKNFGIKSGAIASCIAHDSHNIVCVGTTEKDMCKAVNAIIENKGGISVVYHGNTDVLPLPFAGIMTTADGFKTAEKYSEMDAKVKELGSKLDAPYMTLSFMALLVIPSIKLSDKGLFDGIKFEFIKED